MSKVKITGTVTEVKEVKIDIHPETLVKEALPHMKVDDIIKVLKSLLEGRFRENDPTLPKDAEINWYRQVWEKYSFTDYHKNDDVYTDIRKFTEEEKQYILAIETVYHVLNK
jgi:hypothetical protein